MKKKTLDFNDKLEVEVKTPYGDMVIQEPSAQQQMDMAGRVKGKTEDDYIDVFKIQCEYLCELGADEGILGKLSLSNVASILTALNGDADLKK